MGDGLGKARREIPWSDAEIAALRVLWARGDSCSRIAAALGRTKSMVVGKAHRLALPGRPERPEAQLVMTRRRIMQRAAEKRRCAARVAAGLHRLAIMPGVPRLSDLVPLASLSGP